MVAQLIHFTNKIIKRLVNLRCAVLVLVLFCAANNSFAASIDGVRVWQAPDHIRVVLDLSSPVTHKVMPLHKPNRIVIDIDNAVIKADLSTLQLGDSPISKVRSGAKGKNDLRVVLDINRALKPRSFLLKANKKYGDRLVIDLYDPKQSQPVIKRVSDQRLRDIIIAVDAGHGGEDPGASGPKKLREKKVVLAIAKELNYLLKQQKGYKPVMIRTGDYYVGLQKRRGLARKAQADLLVSIHADAFDDKRAYGTSVYALSRKGASSAMAQVLADDANNSDLVGGVSLRDKDDLLAGVLADLSMAASLDASVQVGKEVVKQLGVISRQHSSKVEHANFSVLRSPDVPSILVETGFISNPGEAKKLGTKTYQRKMAKAIFKGITRHFSVRPPPDTYLAEKKRSRDKKVEYIIARGDTLSAIAQRYQVSVSSLRRKNDLASSVIRVGQKIIIPSS